MIDERTNHPGEKSCSWDEYCEIRQCELSSANQSSYGHKCESQSKDLYTGRCTPQPQKACGKLLELRQVSLCQEGVFPSQQIRTVDPEIALPQCIHLHIGQCFQAELGRGCSLL